MGAGGAGRGEKGRGARRRKEEKEKGGFCNVFIKLVYIAGPLVYEGGIFQILAVGCPKLVYFSIFLMDFKIVFLGTQ